MFIDTHSHIHFFQHFPDVEEILIRAVNAGVSHQIIVGCTPKDSYDAFEFVQAHADKNLWSTLGVHPHSADELTDEVFFFFLRLLQKEKKIVALGEMGLDYFRNLQPHSLQISTFCRQLELAKEFDMPVVVHVREAWDDALKILKEAGNTKVILHCFTAELSIALQCWELGYYTSFSGVVTYPKNEYLRRVVELAPPDKILIETDCPYLTPQVFRGQRNEPAYVIETAKELARLRNLSLAEIAQLTLANAIDIFGLS